MTEEKKEGCCNTEKKCCGCKKFVIGLLAGVALAVIAHCLLCGAGGHCGKSMKVCPVSQMQMPAPAVTK